MTFLEVVMVLLIMGILSVLVLPKITSTEHYSLFVGSRLVRDDIRYAVDYSTHTGKTVKIVFSVPENFYELMEKNPDGSWDYLKRPAMDEEYIVELGTGAYKDIVLTDVDINGMDELLINSQGVPLDKNLIPLQPGGNAFITLNTRKNIQITPVTALVRME